MIQDPRSTAIEEAAAMRCNTLKDGEGVAVPNKDDNEHHELIDRVPGVLSESGVTGSPNAAKSAKMMT